MSAKNKAAPTKQKSFEESLWDTATKLRGSVEYADWSRAKETIRQGRPEDERGGAHQYKHVVLSLIFLKFVSDKFEERRAHQNAPIAIYTADILN